MHVPKSHRNGVARAAAPPDLRRLLVAGMRGALRRAARTGRPLDDADQDELSRRRDELERVADCARLNSREVGP